MKLTISAERINQLEEVFNYFKRKYQGEDTITYYNEIFNYAHSIRQGIKGLEEYQATVESLQATVESLENTIRELRAEVQYLLKTGDYSKALEKERNALIDDLINRLEEKRNDY